MKMRSGGRRQSVLVAASFHAMRIALSPPWIRSRWLSLRNSPSRVLSVTQLQIAGFGGIALLAIVTSMRSIPHAAVLALGLTGMAALGLAWLGLGHQSGWILVKGIYGIGVCWCLPLWVGRPLVSGDVHSYLWQ